MSYSRVIPRDLFNEGDLLNCLGRLWIKLDNRQDHGAELIHPDGHGFVIGQNPSDGSIMCHTIMLLVGGHVVPLWRPLNARTKWPLWSLFGESEDVRVFDEAGELSTDFWVNISQPGLVAWRKERQA